MRDNPAWLEVGAFRKTRRGYEFQRRLLRERFYLAVVVVDAETPEELVVAFAAQALRPLMTAADNANRAKYLIYFIGLL